MRRFELERLSLDRKRQVASRLSQLLTQRRKLQETSTEAGLTSLQMGMLLQNAIRPSDVSLNVCRLLLVRGAVDLKSLADALNVVVRRFEVMRTTFHLVNGVATARVEDGAAPALKIFDLRGERGDLRQLAVDRGLAASSEPYVLSAGPLYRFHAYVIGECSFVLMLAAHHIVTDGESLDLILQKIEHTYLELKQGALPLATPVRRRTEYVEAVRRLERRHEWSAQCEFWKNQLQGSLQVPHFVREEVSGSARAPGSLSEFQIDSVPLERLREVCAASGATEFMGLLAVTAILVHRYTGSSDFCFSVPFSLRDGLIEDRTLGACINVLPVRVHLSGDTSFSRILAEVRERVLGALGNRGVPLERILESAGTSVGSREAAAAVVMFNMYERRTSTFCEADADEICEDPGGGEMEFQLHVVRRRNGTYGIAKDSGGRIARARTAGAGGHFNAILRQVGMRPELRVSELELLSESERQLILEEWNRTEVPSGLEVQTIHQCFERVAETSASSIAFMEQSRSISYDELNRRANRVAHLLRSLKGASAGKPVAVCMERSLESVCAMLGILKSGAPYLPIDSSYPAKRIEHLLSSSGVALVLCDQKGQQLVRQLPVRSLMLSEGCPEADGFPESNPAVDPSAQRSAYLIYTSGSTGKPKGVMGLHSNTLNRFEWMWRTYPFRQGEICCQKTSLGFVDSVWECFGPLLKGVPALICSAEDVRDPEVFVRKLGGHGVTRLVLVPSLLKSLLEAVKDLPERLPKLWMWVVSGEALSQQLAQEFHEKMPGRVLLNLYGSSEIAADALFHEVTPGELALKARIPIGRPISNVRAFVLDDGRLPLPVGVAGELYVGGRALSGGYYQRPDLTAERFLECPLGEFKGEMVFKTGDRAYLLPDGNIQYLGRDDSQVKVRGVRIDLNEVEEAIRQHPGVDDAVVVVESREAGDSTSLVGCFTRLRAAGLSEAEMRDQVRAFLQERLPSQMVPSLLLEVESFPLNPNGKVDRAALLEKVRKVSAAPEGGPAIVQPRDEIEALLHRAWCFVLKHEKFGVNHNLFAAGGDSLKIISVLHHLKDENTGLTVRDMYSCPTITQQAEIVRRCRGTPRFPDELRRGDGVSQCHGRVTDTQELILEKYASRPEAPAYHTQQVLLIDGLSVSPDRLSEILERQLGRHPALRMRFRKDPSWRQFVSSGEGWLRSPFSVVDLSGRSRDSQEGELLDYLSSDRRTPFDLSGSGEAAFRVRVFSLGHGRAWLCWSFHHAVIDGWSSKGIAEELCRSLSSVDSGAQDSEEDRSYFQFLEHVLKEGDSRELWDFWMRPEQRPEAFTARQGWAVQSRVSSGDVEHRFRIPEERSRSIVEQCARQSVTPKDWFLARVLHGMSRFLRAADLSVAVVTNGRTERMSNPLGAVGLYWNFIPLLVRGCDRPLGGLTEAVHARFSEIHGMTGVPYLKLLERWQAGGEPILSYNYHEIGRVVGDERPPDVQFRSIFTYDRFHFPFGVQVRFDRDGEGSVQLWYNGGLAEVLGQRRWELLLDSIAEAIGGSLA